MVSGIDLFHMTYINGPATQRIKAHGMTTSDYSFVESILDCTYSSLLLHFVTSLYFTPVVNDIEWNSVPSYRIRGWCVIIVCFALSPSAVCRILRPVCSMDWIPITRRTTSSLPLWSLRVGQHSFKNYFLSLQGLGREDMIEVLLQHGCDIDLIDEVCLQRLPLELVAHRDL